MISEKSKARYFSKEDWTGRRALKALTKLAFWRERSLGYFKPSRDETHSTMAHGSIELPLREWTTANLNS